MKRRFVAKQTDSKWHVYDTERASYPALVSEFGAVGSHYDTEEEAQAEADRLAAFHNRAK